VQCRDSEACTNTRSGMVGRVRVKWIVRIFGLTGRAMKASTYFSVWEVSAYF
jgi:hypothetical protein